MRRKTFESMAKAYPQLEPLRQLRYVRDKLRTIQLSVGNDNRNRTVLWPFSSKTFAHATESKALDLFAVGGMRFLIKPEPKRRSPISTIAAWSFWRPRRCRTGIPARTTRCSNYIAAVIRI